MKDNSDEIKKALGTLVWDFGMLEVYLKIIAAKLISDDAKIGGIVISEMSYRNLINAFDSLMKYSYSNHDIRNILKELNDVEAQRNTYIHSAYTESPKDSANIHRFKFTAKQGKGLSVTAEQVDVRNIENTCERIRVVNNELANLARKIWGDAVLKFV
ncbi:MAG TPA: hypothetical protein VFU05_05285 [Cyclobacteriaceae bacterium]|nr:hypothetical protein [Cyclobacteriaceae bacterium]